MSSTTLLACAVVSCTLGFWPVFNLADLAIVTGILATTLSVL